MCQTVFAQLCVEDLALDVKLKDKKYIQSQLRCVLADNNDFCDPFGLKLKRVAPDIFKGRCIHPCTKCVQKQVRKVIVALQQNHPKEFNALIPNFRNKRIVNKKFTLKFVIDLYEK